MADWQPIETAPKDAWPVLLVELDDWLAPSMHVGWWSRNCWVRSGDDYDIVVEPTHWQPLPEPPAT